MIADLVSIVIVHHKCSIKKLHTILSLFKGFQYFEELLVSIIMLLGCVDYCTCCAVLMKWEPKFEPSSILTRKYDIFKSILGHTL